MKTPENKNLDQKEQILEVASNLFLRYGIRSVTMDDICRELGMSKKTLYQYFSDKETLVESVTNTHLACEEKEIEALIANSGDVIEMFTNISKHMRESLNQMNPVVMYDLQKYYKKSWKRFVKFKRDHFPTQMEKILRQGMDQGIFRNDIKPDILAVMRLEQVEMIFDDEIYPRKKFNFSEVQMEVYRHFLRGILTAEGEKVFNENHILD
ncbi:MAG: TetR/AcrR family transcriptional regulator [Cyclobacteriaceae bacterium]|nr:TetR/AcrR family transcriptional regulator [Cyclobacteriaceae bacterium]MCH8517142.1 TetR/AcrR family transcriptional regulator [Cyclobacteriaceae bacterium]